MTAIKPNSTVNNYVERSRAIQELETAFTRREQGEKIDLEPISKKISGLMEQLKSELKEMSAKGKISFVVQQAYDLQKKDLTALHARVTANSQTRIDGWFKPFILHEYRK